MRTRCARAQLRVHACDAGPRDIGRPVQSDVQLILIKMAGRAARVDIIIPSPRRRSLFLLPREGEGRRFSMGARGRGNFVVPLRFSTMVFMFHEGTFFVEYER